MEEEMPQVVSISLSKFTSSVQSAVKAAMAKHPKFKSELPETISTDFLIWGYPPPDPILAKVTVAEVQAFADEVASGVLSAHPEAFADRKAAHPALPVGPGSPPKGAVFSAGGHVICGALQVNPLDLQR
jgi:hypothetical protein